MTYSMTAYISSAKQTSANPTPTLPWLARLQTWLQQQSMIRRTQRELQACSDRELNDLGIARCDIPFIARDSVRAG